MHKSYVPVFAAFAGLSLFTLLGASASAETVTSTCGAYAQSNLVMSESDGSPSELAGSCWNPASLHTASHVKHRKLAHRPAVVAKKLAQRLSEPRVMIAANEPSDSRPSVLKVSNNDACFGARANLLCPGYQLLGISY